MTTCTQIINTWLPESDKVLPLKRADTVFCDNNVKRWASKVAQWWRVHPHGRRLGFDSWVRKIPWRRKWQPTPVLPGESHDREAWLATVHGVAEELDMLSTHALKVIRYVDRQVFLEKRVNGHHLLEVQPRISDYPFLARLLLSKLWPGVESPQLASPYLWLPSFLKRTSQIVALENTAKHHAPGLCIQRHRKWSAWGPGYCFISTHFDGRSLSQLYT